MSATAPALTDHEAITKVVDQYIAGGISGRSEDMKPAFFKDATIYGYLGPELFGGPIQGLFDWVDQNPPATGLKCKIANLEIGETVASARLELDDWGGHRFTDMFTLLKVDGEWKIISKVFHLH